MSYFAAFKGFCCFLGADLSIRSKFSFIMTILWSIIGWANFSPIQDEAGLVSQEWIQARAPLLLSLYQNHGVQIQIQIAKSTQGLSIESYSLKQVEKMKLGDQKTDKGLLFLLVPSQREVRIEVGQGLEGDIPDVIAKRIIEDTMIPLFRSKQFEKGLDNGLYEVISKAVPNWEETSLKPSRAKSQELPTWAQVLLFILMILFWMIGPRLGWVGPAIGGGIGRGGFGGRGGSGWSGGGGGFSGGGASGSW